MSDQVFTSEPQPEEAPMSDASETHSQRGERARPGNGAEAPRVGRRSAPVPGVNSFVKASGRRSFSART